MQRPRSGFWKPGDVKGGGLVTSGEFPKPRLEESGARVVPTPVYQGANSCYAIREGFYVRRLRRKGIDTVKEAVAILRLILRDYRRGWTYRQGDCKRIRMTEELFERRVRFVVTLAKFHGADEETLRTIRKIVRYVLEHKRLPRYIKWRGKRIDIRSYLRGAYARKR